VSLMLFLQEVSSIDIEFEFLRGEYYHKEFDVDRELLSSYVQGGTASTEVNTNRIRHELLYRRRRNILQALPKDTRWRHVELERADLDVLELLPRGHWPTFGGRPPRAMDVSARIVRGAMPGASRHHLDKIFRVRRTLLHTSDPTSILLLTRGQNSRLTILEGNNRVLAALTVSAEFARQRLRFLCGISPRMDKCLWYRSSWFNLLRYSPVFLACSMRRHRFGQELLSDLPSSRWFRPSLRPLKHGSAPETELLDH
jgi:hypothetical protein